jgi:hypothetical protein
MSIERVMVDGREYPFAPLKPETWDHPSPMGLLTITPQVAREWLRYNRINRNQRETGKGNYSTDMKEGNFRINGSSVTFTRPYLRGEDENVPEGEVVLLDGQHRLEGCVASGKPFVTYVGYGFDPEVRHTVDTGIKRTYADTLRLRGEKDTNVLSSVVKRAYYWHVGNQHLIGKNKSVTHSRLDEFFQQHKELRRSAEIARTAHTEFEKSNGHPLRQSVAGLAHWLFMDIDETRAPEFFARLGDGAEMRKEDPIMELRRRIVQDLTKPKQERGDTRKEVRYVPDWQQLCYYIRTWNARLIYEGLPESERATFTFAMLGPNDNKKMPSIRTPDEAYDELQKLERRRLRAVG